MPSDREDEQERALAAIRSLKADVPLEAYRGEWVALSGDRVVDHDRDIGQLLRRIGEDLADVVFDHVPEEDYLILAT